MPEATIPVRSIIAASCLALMVACGKPMPAANEQILHRGLSAQPEALDPQRARSVASAVVLTDLYEGLLTRDARGETIAGVVADWTVSADEREYTFRLKANARWSDGQHVDAKDFVRGWRRLVSPDTGAFYADLLSPLENADAVLAGIEPPTQLGVFAADSDTLVVRLAAPQPDFLQRLTHPALSPWRDGTASLPLSNGAYRIESLAPGGRVTLSVNPYFHAAESVAIAAVVYQPFEQELTEYNEFRSAGLDITSRVPRQVFKRRERPDTLRVAPYLGVVYLSFNMRNPPSVSIRRALSLAVDRERLAGEVLGRGELPAFGLVPVGTRNGDTRYTLAVSTLAVLSQAEREVEARALFARSAPASDTPIRITLHYASSDENRVVATALQSMWQRVLPGLTVSLANQEFRVLLARARAGQFEGLVRGSWVADYNDTAQFLAILASGSPANTSGFGDARFDTLLTAAQATADSERRASTLQAAEQIIADQVPVIPLYYFVSKHLVSDRVDGWQDNPLDVHPSRFLALKVASQ